MKFSTVLHFFRTQRLYSAFATEDIKPMSEVFVSWPKLFEVGWKVGGALVFVSQGFTVLQLVIFRMNIKQDFNSLAASVSATQDSMKAMQDSMKAIQDNMKAMQDNMKTMDDNVKTMQDNMKTMQDNMKTMDDKLNKALPKR